MALFYDGREGVEGRGGPRQEVSPPTALASVPGINCTAPAPSARFPRYPSPTHAWPDTPLAPHPTNMDALRSLWATAVGAKLPPPAAAPIPAPVILVIAAGITTSGMMLRHAPGSG